MPRRDEADDYDDTPRRRRNAPLPGNVRAAGIIWLGIGILGIVGSLIGLVGNMAGGAGGAAFCSFGCSLIVPLVFFMVGMQTFKGTAKGTLGNGIGSIIFGLLCLAAPVAIIVLIGRVAAGGAPPGGGPVVVLYIVAALYGVLGLALLAAGGMAIAGRDAYTQWRVAQGLARGAKRTAEQDDYEDDRPRRRRREYDEDDR